MAQVWFLYRWRVRWWWRWVFLTDCASALLFPLNMNKVKVKYLDSCGFIQLLRFCLLSPRSVHFVIWVHVAAPRFPPLCCHGYSYFIHSFYLPSVDPPFRCVFFCPPLSSSVVSVCVESVVSPSAHSGGARAPPGGRDRRRPARPGPAQTSRRHDDNHTRTFRQHLGNRAPPHALSPPPVTLLLERWKPPGRRSGSDGGTAEDTVTAALWISEVAVRASVALEAPCWSGWSVKVKYIKYMHREQDSDLLLSAGSGLACN